MKPIAIFRHLATEGPGYFATYLTRHDVPWRIVGIDEGEAVPGDPLEFSGLVFMGGPMSANDSLPWIEAALSLVRAAVDRQVPVLGHCLGGQLMAKALGGEVTRNPVKEIGWGKEVESLAQRAPSVQTPAQMTEAVEERTRVLNAIADRVYDRWTAGLKRD